MSLASGHHRIMVAARGALVMMVLGKVMKGYSGPFLVIVSCDRIDRSQGARANFCASCGRLLNGRRKKSWKNGEYWLYEPNLGRRMLIT